MNTLPTNPETPDELDRLFSEFFKAQLKQPWPNAPIPTASGATAEPSALVNSRAADSSRATAPAHRDNTARARFTLAASVALAIGACWFLSNGFQPSDRETGPTQKIGGMLPDGGAKDQGVLPEIQKNKALDNPGVKLD